MSKRFTATEIWDNPKFIELSKNAKLLWFYLKDKCDNAGFIDISYRLLEFHLELNGEVQPAIKEIQDTGWIEKVSDGEYRLTGFIEFQYGKLSEDCKPHKQVLSLLEKHLSKGYAKGIVTLQDKDKDKDKDKISEDKIQNNVEPLNGQFPKALLEFWNSKGNLPKVAKLTSKRIDAIKTRQKDPFFVSKWKEAIDRINASDFCTGKNDHGWKATIDWFVHNDNNIAKIVEGKYDNRPRAIMGKPIDRGFADQKSSRTDFEFEV